MTCEKEGYLTHALAREAAAHICARDGVSLRVYGCDVCDLYHLATNGKRKRMKTIRRAVVTKFQGLGENDEAKARKRNPSSQQSYQLATYKLLTRQMADYLKQLIEGNNQLEKQKLNYGVHNKI